MNPRGQACSDCRRTFRAEMLRDEARELSGWTRSRSVTSCSTLALLDKNASCSLQRARGGAPARGVHLLTAWKTFALLCDTSNRPALEVSARRFGKTSVLCGSREACRTYAPLFVDMQQAIRSMAFSARSKGECG